MLALLFIAASPTLVELYTSEGCSSCPPADAVLRDLSKGEVIGMSLHVDYWNDLGWKDPYSDVPATERQHEYARSLQKRVFTPQIVIDGKYSCVGSDRECISNALAKSQPKIALTCSKDAVSSPTPLAGRLTLAWLSKKEESTVTLGENKGKHLTHAWVVRKIETHDAWTGAAIPVSGKSDRLVALVQNAALEVTALCTL